MNKLMQSGILILCCLLLYGCPYQSTVPITTPSIPVDERLLGQWASDAQSYNEFYVSKIDNFHYKVLQQAITGQTSVFKAHLSEIRGVSFLNLYSDSTQTYYLYRINLNAPEGRLTLLNISERIGDQFNSSASLRQFVEKNMNQKSFYDSEGPEDFIKLQANKP